MNFLNKIYNYFTLKMNKQVYKNNKILPLIDTSRNTFLYKVGNAWIIFLCKKQENYVNIHKILKIFNNYKKTINSDKSEHINEFINDLNKKKMIIRKLKESGKYLVFNENMIYQ